MIKFSVSRLEKEAVELEGSEGAEFLDLDPEDVFSAQEPVFYKLSVVKTPGGALVQGECHTVLQGICGRCLADAEVEVSADDIELFLPLDENSAEEQDITAEIRQELLLNLPMNILCDEDCAGLCPECGSNLNDDQCECHKSASGSLAWSALDDLNL